MMRGGFEGQIRTTGSISNRLNAEAQYLAQVSSVPVTCWPGSGEDRATCVSVSV